jgi:hypothetical protein
MKIGRVYREILYNFFEKEKNRFTQKDLSKECKISLSTVNYAIKPLEKIGAIEKKTFGFNVINARKILNFWATIRKLDRDIVYKNFINEKIERIESLIPARCVFTAYTAFKLKFKEVPSDYGEVIVYGKKEDFEERFGLGTEDKKNLIVLDLDEHLLKFKIAPIAQIYVDLWNLDTWYANEFLKKLEEKINRILERYYQF